jgi:hypothetical protein
VMAMEWGAATTKIIRKKQTLRASHRSAVRRLSVAPDGPRHSYSKTGLLLIRF